MVEDALVIDHGSELIKAGFAGDDAPRNVFSSVVGRPKRTIMVGKDVYVGDEAQSKRGILALKYPIQQGYIQDWDDMEKIWNEVFRYVSPEENRILLTEPAMNPNFNREKMAQIMFERFNTPAIFIEVQQVLSLYASGKNTGIVLDCGSNVMHSIPVHNRRVLPHVGRLNWGGTQLTQYLEKILSEKFTFATPSERDARDHIKTKCCYVAVNFEADLEKSKNSNELDMKYDLPTGEILTVASERFRCPEAMFQPSLMDTESVGVHELVFNSITACDVNIQKDLFSNVLLAGGASLLDGFGERIEKELIAMSPSSTAIKVIAPTHRRYSAWIGGSMLASSDEMQKLWITKKQYQAEGARILFQDK